MATVLRALLLASAAARGVGALGRADASHAANPIRRVVSMLQLMQEKVTAEGKKEKDLFDKFMCYCSTGSGDLSASITAAEGKITQDTSSLEAAEASKAQLETDLAGHRSDREEAKASLAEATALRGKEAAVYAKASSDHQTNIAALGKAVGALEKGTTGFLQTSVAARLRQLTIDSDLSSADRDMLSAFLSTGQSASYAPRSGEIIGILKQMKDTMEKDLAEMTATEQGAIAAYDGMSSAKTQEIEANGAAIESKTERHGQVGLEIVALKEDLDDTTKALANDRTFLADLEKNCATKTQEWDERSKTRADELLALAETIKLLSDDDALELFKKTLTPTSLLQVDLSAKLLRQRAAQALESGRRAKDPRMDLVMLALGGRGRSFDKVLTMIDDMVALLGKEQADDDAKKAYCEATLDKTEDEKKVLEQSVADLETVMEETKESIATLTEEISALAAGITALDKSVAEATETREAENAEFKQTMAADQAAKELIGVAKNRLAKFYNPKMYKEAPKRELSAEDRIFVNNGGTPPPTAAPGGIAGTGITYLQQASPVLAQVAVHARRSDGAAAPPPAPETWGAYNSKGQESNGVLAMLDMLVADLDKEMQEMGVEEKDAQAEYETFLENAKAKRAADSQLLAEKESHKADQEARLQKTGEEHKSTVKAAMGKAEELRDLHLDCDWLLTNHPERKEARSGEVESLTKAKAVLSGAGYALVQQARSRTLRGSRAQ